MNVLPTTSAHRLATAVSAADLGVWEWDLTTGSIWYSERAKRITGLDADEEVTLERLREITHPDDRGRSQEILKRSFDPLLRERGAFEWRVLRSDGEIRWMLAHGEAEFTEEGPQGRPLRYIGVIQDVTDYKLADLARSDSEARLRLALDAGRMAVWEFDMAEHRLGGSPELNVLLGFPRESTPSLADIRAGYLPGELDRVRTAARQALGRGDRFIEIEYGYRRPDGDKRWLLLRAEILGDPSGRPKRLIGVLMDVTKRQNADETNAYLAAVVSSSADAIVTVDRAGEILTWNEAAERIFGYCGDEAIGQSLALVSPPGAEVAGLGFIEKAWAGQVIQFEAERKRKQGGLFHAAITAAPVRAHDGDVISVVATVRDATSRKNNERRQALLVRELHHRVRNTLATVQAIAGASARHAESLDEFRETFSQRIGSLAQAHALLTEDNWQSVNVRELLLLELQAYAEGERIALSGPEIVLDAKSAIPMSMAVHELTTNAAKHGALSSAQGRVRVEWTVSRAGEQRMLDLSWTESDGPEVGAPTRRGFGTLLLNTVLRMQLGAQVSMDYAPEGLRFKMTAAIPEPTR
ncbi:MAG TPA: PAS domain S-box protein [Beijerinckiaceae bacterium]|nr:PAS domain S-box protein [Beijerinckiaceae bacterium]